MVNLFPVDRVSKVNVSDRVMTLCFQIPSQSGDETGNIRGDCSLGSETFFDFDAFTDANAMVDGEWLQTGHSTGAWTLDTANLGDVVMQRGHSEAGLIAQGTGSEDAYTFSTVIKSGSLVSSGSEMTDDSISLNEPGAEFCCSIKNRATWYMLAIPKHIVSGKEGLSPASHPYRYRVPNQKQRADFMRNMVGRALSAISETPRIRTSPAARMLAADTQEVLLPLVGAGSENGIEFLEGDQQSPTGHASLIKKTQEILEENCDLPIHVSELSKMAGVSSRTLRRVFNEFYGIGPRDLLSLRQLEQIRRRLLSADVEETTVTNVLTEFGVWEFGRFSGKYKKHFGELPSQTLQR